MECCVIHQDHSKTERQGPVTRVQPEVERSQASPSAGGTHSVHRLTPVQAPKGRAPFYGGCASKVSVSHVTPLPKHPKPHQRLCLLSLALTGTKQQASVNPKHRRHLRLQVHSEGEQAPTPRALE